MLFNSLHFLFFFPIAVLLYYTALPQWRWVVLLVTSCYFYMALIPVYILVLFYLILIDYSAGLWIEKISSSKKKLALIVSLIANIGTLGFFKYWNFLNTNLEQVFQALGMSYHAPHLGWALPIGLSFHTFQSIAYTIEVYFGRQRAERHLGIYAVYVLFFPQMVAGPIERPQHILPQLHQTKAFSYDKAISGLRLMLFGFVKKILIADNLAPYVDQVYNAPASYGTADFWLATYFFTIQIYCDFSGYTDIARGAARLMGIDLMVNFNFPYFSKSIQEFWRRWHISLSSWFRDYLYIPLGGSRGSRFRVYFNILFVFLVSGLWHGANWTFVIWGGLHGLYLILSNFKYSLPRFWSSGVLKTIITFHLAAFAWIFFRANNVHDAFYIVEKIFSWSDGLALHMNIPRSTLVKLLLMIAGLIAVEALLQKKCVQTTFVRWPAGLRWATYYAVLAVIVYFGAFNNHQFIYFQF